MRGLARLLALGAILYAVTWGAVLALSVAWPVPQTVPQGDAIICLGGGIRSDRTPRDDSLGRAETCAALQRAGAAPVVIFTGAGYPDRSAAQAMAEATGLPETALRIEPAAQSTLQNALFSLEMLEEDARLIVVTDAYHLPRSWVSFRLMGAGDIALFPTSRPELTGTHIRRITREAAAIWFNLARYAVWAGAGLLPLDPETRTALLR